MNSIGQRKNWLFLITLSILLIIGLIIDSLLGLYYLNINNNLRVDQSREKVSPPKPVISSIPKITYLKFKSEKLKISFSHPSFITVSQGENEPGLILVNEDGRTLVDIKVNIVTIDQIRQRYPDQEFTPFRTDRFSGYKNRFTNSSVDRVWYLLEKGDGTMISVTGLLEEFSQERGAPEEIVESLVLSMEKISN